ncbi:MAG: hypothetical protein OEY86_18720, partial [Nitrospira sp.]|nr:hypothetical protein [Nitrospira sp.]
MQQTLTWEGLQLAKSESTFIFGKHILTWIDNAGTAQTICELDGQSITLEESFWRTEHGRSTFAAFYRFVKKDNVDEALAEAVRALPHPSVVTPVLQFANYFS